MTAVVEETTAIVVKPTNKHVSSKQKRALAEEKRELNRFATAVTKIANNKRVVVGVNYVEEENFLYSAYLSSYVKTDRTHITVNNVERLNKKGKIKNPARSCENSIEHFDKDAPNGGKNSSNVVITPPPRRCPRRQKSTSTVTKKRVKYDMSQIPQFRRNSKFLNRARSLGDLACCPKPKHADQILPLLFGNDGDLMKDAVIWRPDTRDQWFDCVDEMAGLCAEAALRQALTLHALNAARKKKGNTLDSGDIRGGYNATIQPQEPRPLTKHYVNDRIDIDDPLQGFQFRHKNGGWLQGFLLWTTFTTWTRYFKWDSTHPKSGMNKKAYDALANPDMKNSSPTSSGSSRKWDHNGTLSALLEAQPRSGDPFGNGVVWPTIAEIGILCGVGCGEYLFRMAIDEIISKGTYDFIVLQATDSSYSFYERFGFCRVGAVTIYGKMGCGGKENADKSKVVGYRHWTNPDETNLREMHGAPSYMMAKRISTELTAIEYEGEKRVFSFIDKVSEYFVSAKPTISPLSFSQNSGRKSCDHKEKITCFGRNHDVEDYFLPLLKDLAKLVHEVEPCRKLTGKNVTTPTGVKSNKSKGEDDSIVTVEEVVNSESSTLGSMTESLNQKSRFLETSGRRLFQGGADEVKEEDINGAPYILKTDGKKRKRGDSCNVDLRKKRPKDSVLNVDRKEKANTDGKDAYVKPITRQNSTVCGEVPYKSSKNCRKRADLKIPIPSHNLLNTVSVRGMQEPEVTDSHNITNTVNGKHKSKPEIVSSDEEIDAEDIPRINRIKKEGQGLLSLNASLTLDRPKRLSMRPVLYEAVPASIAPLSDVNKTVTGSCGKCPKCNANCPLDALKCVECHSPCKYVVGSGFCLVAGSELGDISLDKKNSLVLQQSQHSSIKNLKKEAFCNETKLSSKSVSSKMGFKSKLVSSRSVLKQRLIKKPKFYNKVVEFASCSNMSAGYYFVLYCSFDDCNEEIQVATLEPCGTFTQGSKKRRGRVKWKVRKEENDRGDSFIRIYTTSSTSCRPVLANAVSRIIIVEEESWDILKICN